MNKYELALVVDVALAQEQKDSVIKEVSDAIVKSGGKMINHQIWIERHKLSFRLKKCWEATYYLLSLECPASAVLPLQKILRVNERVLRFLITRAV